MKATLTRVFSVLFILTIFPNVLFAQIDTVRFNKYYFKKYWIDSKAIVSSPFRWNKGDWTKFAVFLAAEGGLSLADQSVANFAQDHRSKELDCISKNFLSPFNAKYSFALMGGFLAQGLLAKNKKSVSTSFLMLESYSLSMLFVRIPKNLFGRRRPDAWPPSKPHDWAGPFKGASFPSGHSTAAFAVASVLANQYREHKWIPITAYSVAGLAGLSRIYDNKHWLTDVVAGATIGTLVGNLVSHRKPHSQLTVVPFGNGTVQGIHLAYVFK